MPSLFRIIHFCVVDKIYIGVGKILLTVDEALYTVALFTACIVHRSILSFYLWYTAEFLTSLTDDVFFYYQVVNIKPGYNRKLKEWKVISFLKSDSKLCVKWVDFLVERIWNGHSWVSRCKIYYISE